VNARLGHAKICQDCSDRLSGLANKILEYSVRYDSLRDKRAVFAFMYSRMTDDLAKYIAGDYMAFGDPEWVTGLASTFARRFLNAMDSIDTWLGEKDQATTLPAIYECVPKPWADVYQAIQGKKSYVLEDMIFSMMAHISYDLPLALLELNTESGKVGDIADYQKMNQVLAGNIDDIQKVVAHRYSRLLSFLDDFAGSYDEFLTNYGIRVARAVAWYNFDRISNPGSKADAIRSIESSTDAFVSSVRSPEAWWAKLALRIARLLIPERRRWPRLA